VVTPSFAASGTAEFFSLTPAEHAAAVSSSVEAARPVHVAVLAALTALGWRLFYNRDTAVVRPDTLARLADASLKIDRLQRQARRLKLIERLAIQFRACGYAVAIVKAGLRVLGGDRGRARCISLPVLRG